MLPDKQIDILTEILLETKVHAKKFRISHNEARKEIDALEKKRFLLKESFENKEYYKIRTIALPYIKHPQAKKTLHQLEEIFKFLKTCYKKDPDTGTTYKDIANHLEITCQEVVPLLLHISEMEILSSWSAKPHYIDSATTSADERILDYALFKDIIDQHIQRAKPTQKNNNFLTPRITKYNQSKTPLPHRITWASCAPEKIQVILEEISTAYQHRLFTLCSLGLRVVIDLVGNQVADNQSFKEKLKALVAEKYITEKQKGLVQSALNMGHATMHRGHNPDKEDVDNVIEIINHLLVSVYGNNLSKKLNEKTPLRIKNEPKNK